MTSFALITEGDTDQVVLEEIIQTVYESRTGEEVTIRNVQPLYDDTTMCRSNIFGGWEMLLDFCADENRILEALSVNDYIIIQIDTDICQHPRINISHTNGNGTKSTADLISEMKGFIASTIPAQTYNDHKDKIIFAIAVHSTECWLLPLHAIRSGDKSQIVNCENRLHRALAAKRIKYVKDARQYSNFSKDFRKIKELNIATQHNESLEIFVNSLP